VKLFTVENWATVPSTTTYDGCFVGVAIGPESDEGCVLVNGVLLQAGRVLPLAAKQYNVSRPNGDLEATGAAGGHLPSLTKLQLLLFTSRDELSCDVARPNRRVCVGVHNATAHVARIPFRGRRQLACVISAFAPSVPVDTSYTYTVVGRRFCPNSRSGPATSPPYTIDVTLASGAVPDMSVPLAFYVGGTDNAECWDEIVVSATSAMNAQMSIDSEAIGEIGAR
jgi:hypothetical protein